MAFPKRKNMGDACVIRSKVGVLNLVEQIEKSFKLHCKVPCIRLTRWLAIKQCKPYMMHGITVHLLILVISDCRPGTINGPVL